MIRKLAFIPLLLAVAGGCRHAATTDDERAETPPPSTKTARSAKTKTKATTRNRTVPAPVVRAEPPRSAAYGRPGFAVYEQEGRLWVFRDGSAAHAEFLASGEPAKCVTLIGAGPDAKTVKGAERAALDDFLASSRYGRDGFRVFGRDGRIWVFREQGEALDQFLAHGEPAKSVTLVGAGPDGRTLKGAERKTLDDYVDSAGRSR